jgi:glycosyltransferase involved in cell wall biosynthesis
VRTLLSINNYHYLRGGSEGIYFGTAETFEKLGWQTAFFSVADDANRPCPQARYFADRMDHASGHGRVGQALGMIWSRAAHQRLSALLADMPVDIAHVHNIYHHLSPSVLAALKARHIPVVMTAHDLKLACPNYRMVDREGVCERCKGGRLWNPVLRRCQKDSLAASLVIAVESSIHQGLGLYRRYLDRVITPSRFYRDKLIEWGWPTAKIVHVPNFVPRVTEAPTSPGRSFLYAGRLSPEKGLATLVRAAAMASVPVDIAGGGPDEDALKSLVNALKAPVRFLGRLERAEVSRHVAAARAVLLPSEWYENGPLAAIEAFEVGRPLIGARIGGITELLEEGVTGWGFQAGNADDLARVLRHACDASDASLAVMADACRRRFASEHTEEVYRGRIAAIYDELLAA